MSSTDERKPLPEYSSEKLGQLVARALLRGDLVIDQVTRWGRPGPQQAHQVVFRGSVDLSPEVFNQVAALQAYTR